MTSPIEAIKNMLKTFVDDEPKPGLHHSDTENILSFMKKEGVPIPVSKGEKTKSDPSEVPEGVRLTDEEIANLVSVKVASSITYCAQSMSQSIRSDVGLLFIYSNADKFIELCLFIKNSYEITGVVKRATKIRSTGFTG
ncbi:DUF3231 family protein [Evansella sp. AB-rgal1]|uniref:DUF3231 family protein n=1 Tax=Evansella sp. AB-rgal1 TaxID=3242696 RepID=UPI00359CF061